MKRTLLPFTVCVLLCVAEAGAGPDCGRSSDACRQQQTAATPFMADLKKASIKPAPEQPQAKESGIAARAQAAETKATDARPVAAPAEPPADKKTFLRPGWLLIAAFFMWCLYYFLKEDKKRKSKR